MDPIFLAALPSVLNSLFDAVELLIQQSGKGGLPESFIEARTLVRQNLVARAESLTAPQDSGDARSTADANNFGGSDAGGRANDAPMSG